MINGLDWSSLDSRPLPSWYDEAKVAQFACRIHFLPVWNICTLVNFFRSSLWLRWVFELHSEWLTDYWRGNGGAWYWWALSGSKTPCIVEWHNETYGKRNGWPVVIALTGENFSYQDFAPLFKPTLFDPNAWASLFVQSGAKYVVYTTKHHDVRKLVLLETNFALKGYCNWPSAQAWNWNSVDTGPRLDLVDLLSNSVQKAGLRMGLYMRSGCDYLVHAISACLSGLTAYISKIKQTTEPLNCMLIRF
jgi:alpha-L-fucosidase